MSSSTEDFEVKPEQVENIRLVFKQYIEDDETGSVPVHALKDVMRALGHYLKGPELKEMMSDLDNGCGVCNFEGFLPYLIKKMKEQADEEFYRDMFRILDKKNLGYITCDDLRYILLGLAEEVGLTAEDVDQMIADVDEDGNGEVSFEEFRNLMTSE